MTQLSRAARASRTVALAAIVAPLLCAAGGCGQKGPLMLPGPPAAEQTPPAAAAERVDDERQDDD